MLSQRDQWTEFYNRAPLCEAPYHFANIARSQFQLEYLSEVLRRCPEGGRTLETGVGSGHGTIWLSRRGICAEGIDYSVGVVERARQVNSLLRGEASFHVGDLFELYRDDAPRWNVIHHQGVLEHFPLTKIRSAIAQSVSMADWVVFSVPSVYYPFDAEMGDERLLPLEVWRHIFEPFQMEDLRYYGDPQFGGTEHILCVLRGQVADERMRQLMFPSSEPYPSGITALVLARNEQHNIRPCLENLKGK